MSANPLDWLTEHRFKSLTRREYDWIFEFDGQVSAVVACLWRLVDGGHIRITKMDDGHRFGLPSPVDAVIEVNSLLRNASVAMVDLREGTLDLRIHFDNGHIIELIPESAGYEAWIVHRLNQQFIAVGGGKLAIFGDAPPVDG